MSELDYATVAKLGGIIKTVRISHRFWTADFEITGEEPESAIAAAHEWFSGVVDGIVGDFVVKDVKPQQESEPSGSPEEDGVTVFDVGRFTLAQVPDGRYLLEVYPILSNGKLGEYPEVSFRADKGWMSDMLDPVGRTVDDSPCDNPVNWTGRWKLSAPKKGGKRYRNLISLEIA